MAGRSTHVKSVDVAGNAIAVYGDNDGAEIQLVAPTAIELDATLVTTTATSQTLSLGTLAAAGLSLPELASVEIHVANGSSQNITDVKLQFTDVIGGLTQTVPASFDPGSYDPYLPPSGIIAAGALGRILVALNYGYLRNAKIVITFTAAPVAGANVVAKAIFHNSAKVSTVLIDPATSSPVTIKADGAGFADGLLVLPMGGREYGGGGANAIGHSLHVDADGGLLDVAAKICAKGSGASPTITMSAPAAGYSNYITCIQITKYCTAALTPNATPISVTTTGINNTPSFLFSTVGAQGALEEKLILFDAPIKASAAAAAITVVCPAFTGVTWNVNVWGFAA